MAKLLDIERVKPNAWNPNSMDDETFKSLVADIRTHGIGAIDPIHVRPINNGFECIDGEHRLRAVKKAGFAQIGCEIHKIGEGEAKVMNYRKNRERGNIDCFKEAEFFKGEHDRGLTQQQIADRYGVSQPQVAARLSLRRISDATKKIITCVINPRYKLTPSHLEPIATLNHGQQGKFVKEIVRDHKHDPPTVESIARGVRHIKEEARKTEALRQAVEKAKFKKCPICGKPPVGFNYNWDGSSGRDQVRCDNWHHWSLSKGVEKEKHTTGGTSEPKIPQSIKTERAISEFAAAFRKALAGVLSRVDANGIDSINIDGRTKDGKKIRIDVSFWDWRVSMDLESTGQRIDLSVSDCKIKDHPEIKTRIRTGGYIDSKQKLAKLERQVRNLFQEYEPKGGVRHDEKKEES